MDLFEYVEILKIGFLVQLKSNVYVSLGGIVQSLRGIPNG